ncbi:hypothetical protein QBC47DRAFT_394532 [Echria macrotheca]|uniref:Uncharacterized protein n=1 Tax=Echria macrotheca TaxID=438768 RepID=A0AAJ0B1P3_9PEZI|nr:hypothetical protein QBC47DRAFT_394532 [Echria macrotheca]
MGADRFKKALKGLRGLGRRIPITFHFFPTVPNRLIRDSDHLDAQNVSRDCPPKRVSGAKDELIVHCDPLNSQSAQRPEDTVPPASETHDIPITDLPQPAKHHPIIAPSFTPQRATSGCPVCHGFDPRLHSAEFIRHTELGEEKNALSIAPDLPFSLLWEAEAHYVDDSKFSCPRPGPTPSGHFAPSWSRGSVTCPVRYRETVQHVGSSEQGLNYMVTCKVLDVACELASPDPSYPVQSGRSTITVKGLMSEVRCRVDPDSNGKDLVRNSNDEGADWSIRLTQDVLPPKNMAKEWDKVEETLLFLPVIHYGGQGDKTPHVLTIEGLALRRVAGMMDYFTRVGTLRLQFWAGLGSSLSWQDLLACAASGMAEQVITII